MKLFPFVGIAIVVAIVPAVVFAQQRKKASEEDFVKEKPAVGDAFPDVVVYDPKGKEVKTSSLRGHYTVLTFGCLTWPPFLWNVSGLEAVHRDYGPKGVKMFFIYKSLAHPELAGSYVQPFTLDERLAHARQAEKQLGATVPWLVDAMDNRLKHALGDRANSEFIVDPKGIIVRKRAWSHPAQVRKDLEQLVGPVEQVTKEEDVKLKLELPIKSGAVRGVLPRLKRPEQMQAIVIEPKIDPKGQPFFAKLRAETDPDLFRDGTGKLYLGFHLDPLHEAHWNNLTKPLSFKLEVPDGLKTGKLSFESSSVKAPSDADPREFLVDVENWPEGKSIRLSVIYYACVGEETCHTVKQEYEVHLRRDRDAGKARGEGAGFWDAEGFARQNLARDKNGDGKLNKAEVQGLIVPHFESFDKDQDGLLDFEELRPVSDWLNYHHQPGTAPSTRMKAENNSK